MLAVARDRLQQAGKMPRPDQPQAATGASARTEYGRLQSLLRHPLVRALRTTGDKRGGTPLADDGEEGDGDTRGGKRACSPVEGGDVAM